MESDPFAYLNKINSSHYFKVKDLGKRGRGCQISFRKYSLEAATINCVN